MNNYHSDTTVWTGKNVTEAGYNGQETVDRRKWKSRRHRLQTSTMVVIA